jgi:hypothetical protein
MVLLTDRDRLHCWRKSGCVRGKGAFVAVPMVVPNTSLLMVAGNRRHWLTAPKHNGQRWRALAVRDYESRALPLSYGGGGPKANEFCYACAAHAVCPGVYGTHGSKLPGVSR